jgi:hypothetical protein
MMHGPGKSDSAIVAVKPTNKSRATGCGAGGAKGGGRGECGPATHAPGAVPGKRVTGAGSHTASRKSALWRQASEVGAECPNWARSVLCGGRSAMSVPTAISRIQRSRLSSMADRNGGAIGAPYSLQNGPNGLDWCASHSLAA